jgi:serine/threonine protein kinase
MSVKSIQSKTATYTMIELLKSREFCQIYRASSSSYFKDVIVRYTKKSEYVDAARVKAGFARVSSIQHPSLAPLIEWFELPDSICAITEWFDGSTLRRYLQDNASLSEDRARELFTKVLDLVEFLHEKGLSHRDISDESLMVAPNGDIRLVGMSWITVNGVPEVIAKDPYTAFDPPEAVLKKPTSGIAADNWALGVLLYMLVMKKPPWEGSTPGELYWAMSSGNVLKPACMSTPCHALILRFLDQTPNRRFSPSMARQQAWMTAHRQGHGRTGRFPSAGMSMSQSLGMLNGMRQRRAGTVE